MIRARFLKAKEEGKKLFIAYLTAGDPSMEATLSFALELEKNGTDVLELGIPHSDPIADGATLLRSAGRALSNGASVPKVFELVKNLRLKGFRNPILLFSYLNPILKFGMDRYCEEAKKAGVDGNLVVDLPPEEAHEYLKVTDKHGLERAFLASPTTSEERLKRIAEISTGFIYVVARTGITGERTALDPNLVNRVSKIRKLAGGVPLAAGFGVSTPEQSREIAEITDGVIVGSAFMRVIEEASSPTEALRSLGRLSKQLSDFNLRSEKC